MGGEWIRIGWHAYAIVHAFRRNLVRHTSGARTRTRICVIASPHCMAVNFPSKANWVRARCFRCRFLCGSVLSDQQESACDRKWEASGSFKKRLCDDLSAARFPRYTQVLPHARIRRPHIAARLHRSPDVSSAYEPSPHLRIARDSREE